MYTGCGALIKKRIHNIHDMIWFLTNVSSREINYRNGDKLDVVL